MDLSIVIVNWNTRALLSRCLEAVYTTISELDFEVWVVDNASSDGSPEMVRKLYPQVNLIENQSNQGFARGNNRALPLCQGKNILLLNTDAFLSTGVVQQMITCLHARPDIGIIGPQMINPDGSHQESHGPLPGLFIEMKKLSGLDKIAWGKKSTAEKPASSCTVEITGFVKGACMLIRRTALEQIGLLDERYFMFNEEIDLCLRANKASWKIGFLPNLQVLHLEAGSTGLVPGRVLRLYRAKSQFFAKHRGWVVQDCFLAAVWTTALVKLFYYGLIGRLKPDAMPKAQFWKQIVSQLGTLSSAG